MKKLFNILLNIMIVFSFLTCLFILRMMWVDDFDQMNLLEGVEVKYIFKK